MSYGFETYIGVKHTMTMGLSRDLGFLTAWVIQRERARRGVLSITFYHLALKVTQRIHT